MAHGAPAGAGWAVSDSDVALGGAPVISRDGRALAVGVTCGAAGCNSALATRAPGGVFVPAGEVPGQSGAFTALRDGAALLVTTSPQHRGLRGSENSSGYST